MKKNIRKKLLPSKFIFLCLIFLFLVGTTLAVTITNGVIIDKVGNIYKIYKLSYETTKEKANSDITKKNSDITKLNKEEQIINSEILVSCISNCPNWCQLEAEYLQLKEPVKGCVEDCSFRCEIEREFLLSMNEKEINKIQDEITELNEILKVK